jgi:muramoyltetrapeptide carboxypeptidase LdcA involved in peptidoglycan recycling
VTQSNSFTAKQKPPALSSGDTIAIVSPGRWTEESLLRNWTRELERFGYNVFLHPQNFLRFNQFAGSVADRISAIHDVFEDQRNRAIMLSKAGNGALHLLDQLD